MTILSFGKLRGLQQCSTRRGALSVLAMDHRDDLRKLLHPDAPGTTTYHELANFKRAVVHTLASNASAVLLDPEYGAAQCTGSGSIPGSVGLIIAAERHHATIETARRLTTLGTDVLRPNSHWISMQSRMTASGNTLVRTFSTRALFLGFCCRQRRRVSRGIGYWIRARDALRSIVAAGSRGRHGQRTLDWWRTIYSR